MWRPLTAERDAFETQREAPARRWEEDTAGAGGLSACVPRCLRRVMRIPAELRGQLAETAAGAEDSWLGRRTLLFAAVDENVVAAVVPD